MTLSDDFMLHVYGEREIISIVEFENFSKFKEAEQQTYEINKKKYFQRIVVFQKEIQLKKGKLVN